MPPNVVPFVPPQGYSWGVFTDASAPVLDVRSAQEYAIAHIPGSRNFYEKEVEQILTAYPDPATPLVFYCNGPYCGKSKRLSEELLKRGYSGIRRYQLGLPVWRALGNTVQTDLAGLRYILAGDRTAIYVDTRAPDAFARGSLPRAVNRTKGILEQQLFRWIVPRPGGNGGAVNVARRAVSLAAVQRASPSCALARDTTGIGPSGSS